MLSQVCFGMIVLCNIYYLSDIVKQFSKHASAMEMFPFRSAPRNIIFIMCVRYRESELSYFSVMLGYFADICTYYQQLSQNPNNVPCNHKLNRFSLDSSRLFYNFK